MPATLRTGAETQGMQLLGQEPADPTGNPIDDIVVIRDISHRLYDTHVEAGEAEANRVRESAQAEAQSTLARSNEQSQELLANAQAEHDRLIREARTEHSSLVEAAKSQPGVPQMVGTRMGVLRSDGAE